MAAVIGGATVTVVMTLGIVVVGSAVVDMANVFGSDEGTVVTGVDG